MCVHNYDVAIKAGVHDTGYHQCAIDECDDKVKYLVEFDGQWPDSNTWWAYVCETHFKLLFRTQRPAIIKSLRADSVGLLDKWNAHPPFILPSQVTFEIQYVRMSKQCDVTICPGKDKCHMKTCPLGH